MFDFRAEDKVIVLEDIIGKLNVFDKGTITLIPKGAKGFISSINESKQTAVVQFERDQNTAASNIQVTFDKIQLQRKRRTCKKSEVKEGPQTEVKQDNKKVYPKTSGELCKMFLDGKQERMLTVKQTNWLTGLLEKEERHATSYKHITCDGISKYQIHLMPNGSSRVHVVE